MHVWSLAQYLIPAKQAINYSGYCIYKIPQLTGKGQRKPLIEVSQRGIVE